MCTLEWTEICDILYIYMNMWSRFCISYVVHTLHISQLSPYSIYVSNADFYCKVRPYKDVIAKHIREEIGEFHYMDTLPKTINLSPRIWIERKDEKTSIFKKK